MRFRITIDDTELMRCEDRAEPDEVVGKATLQRALIA